LKECLSKSTFSAFSVLEFKQQVRLSVRIRRTAEAVVVVAAVMHYCLSSSAGSSSAAVVKATRGPL
jgi:hypothetical protein